MAGGGAHGSVQWGCLQALAETDIAPDQLIGTSAGSLTSAIYGEDPLSALSRLAYVWSQLDLNAVLGSSRLSMLTAATKLSASLADNGTERETLEHIYRARSFDDLQLPTAVVATDLATGQATAFTEGDLITALMASTAIPGLLPPVEINGRLYIDGLASANLPARLAVEGGAGTVIVLDTGGREPVDVGGSPIRMVGRVNSILNARQRTTQLTYAATRVPTIVLPTPQDLGAALDFRETMSAASRTYELSRRFLFDLANQASGHRGTLPPGLYTRAGDLADDPDLGPLLQPVSDSPPTTLSAPSRGKTVQARSSQQKSLRSTQ